MTGAPFVSFCDLILVCFRGGPFLRRHIAAAERNGARSTMSISTSWLKFAIVSAQDPGQAPPMSAELEHSKRRSALVVEDDWITRDHVRGESAGV